MFALVVFLACVIVGQSLATVAALLVLLIRQQRQTWKLSRAALVDESTFARLEVAEEQRKAPTPKPQPRLDEPELPRDLQGLIS